MQAENTPVPNLKRTSGKFCLKSLRRILHFSDHVIKIPVGDPDAGIRTAVVDCDPAGCGIMQRRTGEDHVRHVSHPFIRFFRRQQIIRRPFDDLRRIVKVQQGRAEGIDKPVAAGQDAMINQQPSGIRFNRHRTGADLCGLPAELYRAHHQTMVSPVMQIRAAA